MEWFLIPLTFLCIVLSIYSFGCWYESNYCEPLFDWLTNVPSIFETDSKSEMSNVALSVLIVSAPVTISLLYWYVYVSRKTTVTKSVECISIAHFMASWTDRMWQIAIPLVFMDIFKDTLLPTALYTTFVYVFLIQLLPWVGNWIDQNARLYVQQYSNAVENCCVILTALIFCYVVLSEPSIGVSKPEWNISIITQFVILIVLGCFGELMNHASTLAIERDWVVVICKTFGIALTKMNTRMRRIDLVCKIIAPGVFTIVYSMYDTPRARIFYSGALIALWNILSFPVEFIFNGLAYHACDALAHKEHRHGDGTTHQHAHGERPHVHIGSKVQGILTIDTNPIEPGNIESVLNLRSDEVIVGYVARSSSSEKSFIAAWRFYRNNVAFFANLAYTMLWMTVLDNGALMTSYFQWRGIPAFYLGLGRGVGAACGLLGTIIFSRLKRLMNDSVEYAGCVSVALFTLLVSPCVFLTGASEFDAIAFLASVAISRVALWMFDLAITEICQSYVQAEYRGLHGSVQAASYQFFFILIQVLTMVRPEPSEFHVLVNFSWGTLVMATTVYTYWLFCARFSNQASSSFSKSNTNYGSIS